MSVIVSLLRKCNDKFSKNSTGRKKYDNRAWWISALGNKILSFFILTTFKSALFAYFSVLKAKCRLTKVMKLKKSFAKKFVGGVQKYSSYANFDEIIRLRY